MSGRSGGVTTTGALLGILLAGVVAALTIAGLQVLVRPGDQLPPLDAPVQPAAGDRCPEVVGPDPVPVTAAELIECPGAYDGAQVRYTGEVVRAVLELGERAVVQVNDDVYALSLGPLPEHRTTRGGNSGMPVVLPWAVADRLHHVGDFRHHGDVITVVGTFRQADPADDGGPTISADSAVIVRPGRELPRSVDRTRLVVAALLLVIVLGLAAAAWAGRRRRRRVSRSR